MQKTLLFKKLIIGFTVFLAFGYALSAQQATDNKSRVESIFAIVKYFTWPNEASIDTFIIAVLDKGTSLEKDMNNYLITQQLIHKKPGRIVRFSNIDDIGKCNSLFASKDNGYDIDKILKKISGLKVLLITENYEFHKSMVNYIYVNNIRRYEINQTRVKEEGFAVNELFAAGAVQSKADWEKLYKQTDIELQKEKEIVEQQQKVIENQKKEIAEQEQRIAIQRKEIDEQQKRIDAQKQELTALLLQVNASKIMLQAKLKELSAKQKELDEQKEQITKQYSILENQKSEIAEQESKISEQKKVLAAQLEKIHLQQFILYMFFALALVLAGLGFFIYRAYKIKKQSNKLLTEKNNEIMQQNEEIRQQKEEIEAQRDEIERQKDEITDQRNVAVAQRDEIAHQKKEITDSIHYARRIQQAVLPPPKFLSDLIKENYFILNKPRDIVSGDYYWLAEKDNQVIIAAADCTGHGVPGAFMSLLGVTFLKEIMGKLHELTANEILDELRKSVINALHQPGVESYTRDGMDMALCIYNLDTLELQFAGANNPLWLVRNGELIEYKADKQPIGFYEENKPFTNNIIKLHKGDAYYIFSDGYADQFGGPKVDTGGKKFKYSRFKELLISIQNEKMPAQQDILFETIEAWRGPLYQVDDILVIGVRV